MLTHCRGQGNVTVSLRIFCHMGSTPCVTSSQLRTPRSYTHSVVQHIKQLSTYSWNLIGFSNTLTYLHFIIRIQPALYSLQSAATLSVVSCAGVTAKVIYSGGADLGILPQHASKGKGLEFLLGEVCHSVLHYYRLSTSVPLHCIHLSHLFYLFVFPCICSCFACHERLWCTCSLL